VKQATLQHPTSSLDKRKGSIVMLAQKSVDRETKGSKESGEPSERKIREAIEIYCTPGGLHPLDEGGDVVQLAVQQIGGKLERCHIPYLPDSRKVNWRY